MTGGNQDANSSRCPRCDERAVSWDWLIPVVGNSSLKIKGRCNYCGQPLAKEYGYIGIRDEETDKLIEESV